MPTADKTNDPSAAALWVVLARAYRAMAAFVEHSLAALGIGLSDFMILEALLHKGPLTMSELCEAALITNASMTAAIDRLEQRDFVERVASKEDRRVRRVQLTAQGTALIRKLYVRHERDLEDVMAGVPAAQRAELRRALKAIGLAAQAKLL
ncbi:MAG TPA: MarR family transcriptional regulator [Acidobacteriaceae bacterium]|jgi:MarR family 2-MHQ and catechol resistance regulon transcriptional repressor